MLKPVFSNTSYVFVAEVTSLMCVCLQNTMEPRRSSRLFNKFARGYRMLTASLAVTRKYTLLYVLLSLI